MVHFDIKRLACIVRPGSRVTGQMNSRARGAGFEYLHTAIDDHSRISFAAMLPDQTHRSAIRFFLMAREHFNRLQRQRTLLPAPALSADRPTTQYGTKIYSPLHAAHQRQGRTLHPNRPARVGLRAHIPELG
jgi:hypothetical protein